MPGVHYVEFQMNTLICYFMRNSFSPNELFSPYEKYYTESAAAKKSCLVRKEEKKIKVSTPSHTTPSVCSDGEGENSSPSTEGQNEHLFPLLTGPGKLPVLQLIWILSCSLRS